MTVTCLAMIFYITSAVIIIYLLKLGILIKMSDVAHRPLVLIYVIKGLSIELVLGGKKDV